VETIKSMDVYIEELNVCFKHKKGRCPKFKVITVLRKFTVGELVQT
jgi:hypothetical protein